MNEVARANWEKYVADEMEEPMCGHLVSYPVTVDQDGTVIDAFRSLARDTATTATNYTQLLRQSPNKL